MKDPAFTLIVLLQAATLITLVSAIVAASITQHRRPRA